MRTWSLWGCLGLCAVWTLAHSEARPSEKPARGRWLAQTSAHLEQLPALSPEHRRILWSSEHDKPYTRGRHYYKTNESRHELYRPYLLGLRGGYIGIASSQNYNMMAWAKSEFAWLIDFDDGIQDIHSIHRAFLLPASTPEAFLRHWGTPNRQASTVLLRNTYQNHPNRERIIRIFQRFQAPMYQHLTERYQGPASKQHPNWLNHTASFQHIRRMYQTDRIRIVYGDLLGEKTLRGIGAAARQVKLPVRVLYLSNAEEWFSYRSAFRKNIQGLPFDQQSVVIRTMWEKDFQPRASDDWQYNIQQGIHFQQLLSHDKTRSVYSLNPWMMLAKEWGLTLIGVPLR